MSPQKVQELLNELFSSLQMPFMGSDACNELARLIPNLHTDKDIDLMITAIGSVTDREADAYFADHQEAITYDYDLPF